MERGWKALAVLNLLMNTEDYLTTRDVLVDFDYAYQQGRADAIDECINKFKQRNCIDTKCKIRECSKCIVYMLMEQLKEQK